MSIASCTADDVRAAMARFDAEMRTSPDWANWDEKKNHKFAFLEQGRRYPMKEIISMASGTSKDDFNGGEEAIRYAKKLGFDVEALHLPSEGETATALHDLLLASHPDPVQPSEAYEALARYFHLSKSLRSLTLADGRSQWENRVQWARNSLSQSDILDNRERGVWRLKPRDRPKFWIEKTLVKGRTDREHGPNALGQALWSPIRDVRGGDIYRNMRLIEPGDIVFHLIDNDRIAGVSTASSWADPSFHGVSGTDWADRPCYRIALQGYQELKPTITRSQFLDDAEYQDQLREVLKHNDNVFYNSNLELRQGAYLTEAPPELIDTFDEIYRRGSGHSLPHVHSSSKAGDFDEPRLRASILLFKWIYGEEGFASERYLREERDYKTALAAEWRELVTKETLERAISGETIQGFASSIGTFLAKNSNLLPWRYAEAIRVFSDHESARSFLIALKSLLFDGGSVNADVDGFNAALMPRYAAKLNETAIKPASHCIPSLALWLTYPDQHFFVRPELYNRARKILTGSAPEGQGNVMTTEYYRSALDFAKALRDALSALNPRDMIDVQSFCWGVFSRNKIWFGGKSYGGTRDMLPEFISRQVYAIGFGRREDIAALLKDVPVIDKETRAARRQELESKSEQPSERKALVSFFDLASAPGSVLLAKSTWFDKGLEQSLLRISGVCRTGDHVSFDEKIGHQVSVEWLSTPDHVVQAQDYYPGLATTLTSHPLEKALDIIGQPPPRAMPVAPTQTEEAEEAEQAEMSGDAAAPTLPIQPRYEIEDFVADTGFSTEVILGWNHRLMRKMHVVFQGPPGTGKTYVSERLARLIVSQTTGTWDVVQFHPSYSYEDFMQGIRP